MNIGIPILGKEDQRIGWLELDEAFATALGKEMYTSVMNDLDTRWGISAELTVEGKITAVRLYCLRKPAEPSIEFLP